MRQEEILVRRSAVGGFVLLEWGGTTIIEKVYGDATAGTVCCGQGSIEVLEEIDGNAVLRLPLCEDSRDFDTDIGLRVIADNDGVYDQSEHGQLVFGGVLPEEGVGIVVTDRSVGSTLC